MDRMIPDVCSNSGLPNVQQEELLICRMMTIPTPASCLAQEAVSEKNGRSLPMREEVHPGDLLGACFPLFGSIIRQPLGNFRQHL